jgi:hypothetical protein
MPPNSEAVVSPESDSDLDLFASGPGGSFTKRLR